MKNILQPDSIGNEYNFYVNKGIPDGRVLVSIYNALEFRMDFHHSTNMGCRLDYKSPLIVERQRKRKIYCNKVFFIKNTQKLRDQFHNIRVWPNTRAMSMPHWLHGHK